MSDKADGLRRVASSEKNSQSQGRSGGGTKKLEGPVRSVHHNPVNSGGINRATKGTGAGKKEY